MHERHGHCHDLRHTLEASPDGLGGLLSLRWMFAAVSLLAGLAGLALWLGSKGPGVAAVPAEIAPASIQAASFSDTRGRPQSLGQFSGKVVVVNFWATWCAPCREEMPAFVRLQERWSSRNVQFVGLANEEPLRVERFAKDLGINYPLWVGGDEVGELSRRLGNRLGVLPHTVLLDGQGRIVESRVGTYSEALLEERLKALAPKRSLTSINSAKPR